MTDKPDDNLKQRHGNVVDGTAWPDDVAEAIQRSYRKGWADALDKAFNSAPTNFMAPMSNTDALSNAAMQSNLPAQQGFDREN